MAPIQYNRISCNDNACFIGIYDFSYAPYALGDALTWQMNVCVKAIEHGCDEIELYIVADPAYPSSRLQTYISASNYKDHLNNLFPVFLCCPHTTSITLIQDKISFDLFMSKRIFGKHPSWPGAVGHLSGILDITSHKSINAFFSKHNYIPRLTPPKGFEHSMDQFLIDKCRDRFVVSVNMRQRKLYPTSDQAPYSALARDRDSPMSEWHDFFDTIRTKHPEVVFLVLGGYSTWNRELYHFDNVIIPRTLGFGLAHELALMHKSDMFVGTSSGFSAQATFSEIPYIITNFEPYAAPHVGLPVGTSKFPFALDNQILIWEKESTQLLMRLFEPMYESLRASTREHPQMAGTHDSSGIS